MMTLERLLNYSFTLFSYSVIPLLKPFLVSMCSFLSDAQEVSQGF